MSFEVVVVGLGAVGSATLYQLARRGVRVLGIDRGSPPHSAGSSGGESRITRRGIGEGEAYVPLAIRSHEIWRELEETSGEPLWLQCGLLILGPEDGRAQVHGAADFVERSASAALRHGIAHERLDTREIGERFPQFILRGDETAYFEPEGGVAFPERCIAAHLMEAEALGAVVLRDTEVAEVLDGRRQASVITDSARFEADAVVLAAGAWLNTLAPAALRLAFQSQTLHWFECGEPDLYAPGRMPAFIWMHGEGPEDSFYGFPAMGEGFTPGVKLAMECVAGWDRVEDASRDPPQSSSAMHALHVSGRLHQVGPKALRSQVCLYSMSPDADFSIGRAGDHGRLLVASACCGHGFKHSAAVGELIARSLTESGGSHDISRFDPGRFAG